MRNENFSEKEIDELESALAQTKNLEVDINRREADLESIKAAIQSDIDRFKNTLSVLQSLIHTAREKGWRSREEVEELEREENKKRKLEKLAKEAEEKKAQAAS